MKSKIQTAMDNLSKAILEEMDEMSENHRKTLKELVSQSPLKTDPLQVEQTKSKEGWECPRCHQINSYFKMNCDCPLLITTATTFEQPVNKEPDKNICTDGKEIPEKCKNCFITQMAKDRGLSMFECKGRKDQAFCNLHYDRIDDVKSIFGKQWFK